MSVVSLVVFLGSFSFKVANSLRCIGLDHFYTLNLSLLQHLNLLKHFQIGDIWVYDVREQFNYGIRDYHQLILRLNAETQIQARTYDIEKKTGIAMVHTIDYTLMHACMHANAVFLPSKCIDVMQ